MRLNKSLLPHRKKYPALYNHIDGQCADNRFGLADYIFKPVIVEEHVDRTRDDDGAGHGEVKASGSQSRAKKEEHGRNIGKSRERINPYVDYFCGK